MKTGLKQRGRANFNLLADLAAWSGRELQASAEQTLGKQLENRTLPEGARERLRLGYELLGNSRSFAWDRFYTRVIAERQYVAALEAYEDGEAEIRAEYEANADKGGVLELNPDVEIPEYWTTEFHLTPGGWDGHEHMGFMIHDYVYDLIFATGGIGAIKPGDHFSDLRYVAAVEGNRDHYDNILELGIGTGRYALALQRAYPNAKIHGVDLGATELLHAKLIAARSGFEWNLRQAQAEATGYDADTFDLTSAFILFHEIPAPAAKAVVQEAFRVTKPGGEFLVADVAPYSEHENLFRSVVLDWETENRNEPFWRGALLTDRKALLESAGFVDVQECSVGTANYPWITKGVKPAA
ncbi:class I SAM-dependent methyltransferase [Micromonospora sp. DT41]|uniref:class I SAM-dependent methyltransferase n=1 Tax=Micromonospora sp. DT41 TaxID=3393437 RepID=UPI003CF256DF